MRPSISIIAASAALSLLASAAQVSEPAHAASRNRDSAPKAQDVSGIDLYRKSLAAAEAHSYAGHQYITTWTEDGHSTTVVTAVAHRARYEFLQRFTAPKSRAGRVILENASNQWTYVPRTNVVIQTARPPQRPDEPDFGLLKQNYALNVAPKREKIAGRDSYVVTIASKHRKDKALRYWVDVSTGLALRSERYHADGDLASVSYFSDINFHPAFAASTFSPTQWPGARVQQMMYKSTAASSMTPSETARSLGGHAVAPANMREFKLKSVTRLPAAKQETLHLHYSDGLTSLSVFETLKAHRKATRMPGSRPIALPGGNTGRIAARGNYCILNFDTPRNTITLLGDLSPETLVDLASSLPVAATSGRRY
ncbi:MAG TPA: outer membrane lipoprotein-sorting protein [Capsulimonadaceae bacterium]|jgi:outer membrane lipoprotein-sorting protein